MHGVLLTYYVFVWLLGAGRAALIPTTPHNVTALDDLSCGADNQYYHDSVMAASKRNHTRKGFWKRQYDQSKISIEVVITVVKGGGPVVNHMNQDNYDQWLKVLNDAYSDFNFMFNKRRVNEIQSPEVSARYNAREDPLRVLETTDRTVLNLVVAEKIYSRGKSVRGSAMFPWDFGEGKVSGIYINADAMPPYQFSTLPHEVGHWLGLLHTFDLGCPTASVNNVQLSHHSDFVLDTELANSYRGKTTRNGQCPNELIPEKSLCYVQGRSDPEPYPVFNFMSYSSPQCRSQFTQGQGKRMRAMWAWREYDFGPPQESIF
jgi:hypothetical protein